MSKVTELAAAQLTAVDSISIELIEAAETPAVVIIIWPAKPTVCHPGRFPELATTIAKLAAEAHTKLAGIKSRRPL
jgi:hypothetical protein